MHVLLRVVPRHPSSLSTHFLKYPPAPAVFHQRTRWLHASARQSFPHLTRTPSRSSAPFLRLAKLYSTIPEPPAPPKREDERVSAREPAKPTLRENIYTLPNLLTLSRIAACPVLGYAVLADNFVLATGLLAYAGFTDLLDGYLARTYNMSSVLGTILDPAADKTLMTTLVVTLAMKGLLPQPLAVIILGRDILLSLSAFWIRYTSLPYPKTFQRYWDFSIPSAEVRPTAISKVNTALQLLLMGATTISPLLPALTSLGTFLWGLQWTVATTTIWSGLSYVFTKDAVRVLSDMRKPKEPRP